MPKLIYQDPETGLEKPSSSELKPTEITIGRNPGNELRINNPSISRKHAQVSSSMQTGQCTITDLKSSNGTYVNGTRIHGHVLTDGDRVRVGEFPLDYVRISRQGRRGPRGLAQPAEPPNEQQPSTSIGGFKPNKMARLSPRRPDSAGSPYGGGGEPQGLGNSGLSGRSPMIRLMDLGCPTKP